MKGREGDEGRGARGGVVVVVVMVGGLDIKRG